MTEYGLSERRSCGLVGLRRSTCRYAPRRDPARALRERLHALAAQRRRFGYRRLTVLLRREGLRMNHKRVYRLYRAEGLAVRRRKRKRCARVAPPPLVPATRINQRWAMDFMKDQLMTGRAFRVFNLIDEFSRKAILGVSQVCYHP
jgi:putative transposase